jgi:hypothetical protein
MLRLTDVIARTRSSQWAIILVTLSSAAPVTCSSGTYERITGNRLQLG